MASVPEFPPLGTTLHVSSTNSSTPEFGLSPWFEKPKTTDWSLQKSKKYKLS
jgi:hypothetical protein